MEKVELGAGGFLKKKEECMDVGGMKVGMENGG